MLSSLNMILTHYPIPVLLGTYFFHFLKGTSSNIKKGVHSTDAKNKVEMVGCFSFRYYIVLIKACFIWVDSSVVCCVCGVYERSVFVFNRTDEMHHFIKMSLQKNPKKRPPAEKLLTVRQSSQIGNAIFG